MSSMQRTLMFSKLLVAWLGCAALAVHAADVADPDKRDALTWLKLIQAAAQKQNYVGTFVFQQANQVRTSRVTHVLDGKTELEKLEILDGRPIEYIRVNDEVSCYIPGIHTIIKEKRSSPESFPGMIAANPADLLEHYDIKKGEMSRVAGYDCQTIVLEPKDDLRYGYRLCGERATGLLLGAQTIQTIKNQSQLLEQISFAQVMIGGVDKGAVRPSFPDTASWHVETAATMQASLSGWSVNSVPPGFKKVYELLRMVPDSDAGAGGQVSTSQHKLAQVVYSDGLAAISVFVEPITRSRTDGVAHQGAMSIVGKRQDDHWLTIVGEVPTATVQKVADSITFQTK